MSSKICLLEAGHTQKLDFLASTTFTYCYLVVPISSAITMTAVGAAAETMPSVAAARLWRRIYFSGILGNTLPMNAKAVDLAK